MVVDFLSFSGFSNLYFAHKFKALKVDLYAWNEEVFCNVEKKRKHLMEGLRVLEGLEEGGGLSKEVKMRKFTLINDLERTPLLGEVGWS
jgi:hypothetical protein